MSEKPVDKKIPNYLLSGKTAIVTGASRGIGRATAIRLAEAGANVVVNYFQHHGDAAEVVAECEKRGARAIATLIERNWGGGRHWSPSSPTRGS